MLFRSGLLSKRMVEATKASGIPKSEADVMTDIREANSVLENDARFKEVFNKLYPVLEDNSPIRDEFVRMQGLRQVSANAKDKADVIAYRAKVLTDFFSKVTTDELQNDVTKGGAFSIAIDPKYKSTYEALAREKAKVGIIDVYKALTDKMEDKDPNKAAILNDLTSKYKAAIGATQSYLYGKGDSLAPLNLRSEEHTSELQSHLKSRMPSSA